MLITTDLIKTVRPWVLIALGMLHGAAAAAGFDGTMSGSWWNPERSGEGQFLTFEQAGDRQVAMLAYFTYDDQGQARWLVGNIDFSAGSSELSIPMITARGPRFGMGFEPEAIEIDNAGTAELTFIDCGRIAFRYEDEGETLDFDLVRLIGPLEDADCAQAAAGASVEPLNGALSGAWWDPARGGEGQFLSVETLGDQTIAMFYYFTYNDNGDPTWRVGSANIAPNADRLQVGLVTGTGARFGSAFSSADVALEPAGTVRLSATACAGLRMRFEGEVSFGLNLSRLGGPLIDLPCPTPPPEIRASDLALLELIEANDLSGDPSAGRDLPGPDAPLVELGKKLFFSKTLSADLDVACASCHHPALGGADGLSISIGVDAANPDLVGPGRRTADGEIHVHRNAISFFNSGLLDRGLLWDSRVESLTGTPGLNGSEGGIRTPASPLGVADPDAGPNLLSAQARLPVVTRDEMRGDALPGRSADEVRDYLAQRLGNYGEGQGLLPESAWLNSFQAAFGSTGEAEELITFSNIALALGEYQRSAVFVESPWSEYVRGDLDAIDTAAKRGAMLFFGTVEEGGMNCVRCHSGDLFTNESHRRVGFPQIGPGFGDGDDNSDDFGRSRETGDPADQNAFRTPTLLNLTRTAPYGHTGAYRTLSQIAGHYFNPTGTATGPLLSRLWCELPPFDTQPDCEARAEAVLANTNATLDSMRATREEDPDISMPQIPNDFSTQENFDDLVAFLETLTDPCLTDPACYSRWIPGADKAPDDFQLNAVDRDGEPL